MESGGNESDPINEYDAWRSEISKLSIFNNRGLNNHEIRLRILESKSKSPSSLDREREQEI